MQSDRPHLLSDLDELHARYNRPEFIHPDPLECVYKYTSIEDREAAGIISASLAYGRVDQILRSVAKVLDVLGPAPSLALREMSAPAIASSLKGFQHRWTTADETAKFLRGLRRALVQHGTLEACFARHHKPETGNTLAGLEGFATELNVDGRRNSLLPSPAKGSACKRHHLFLRWMTRSDAVDPGCWKCIDPAHLVVPLDTHMHRVGKMLGFTRRANAGIRTALEITDGFKALVPEDPVRYDFTLTRFGIRPDMDWVLLAPSATGAPRSGVQKADAK